MNRLKELLEKHLFLIWIICSGLFAFIIHCLFSITAPNEWLDAKWGAGDILIFVSTVALGLLAVWQNKKFKEENAPDNAEVIKLLQLISKYSECSIELTQKIRTNSSADGTYKEKADAEKELIISFSDFISNREAMLNKVIFEYLTLDQIKAMYSGHPSKEDS